MLLGPSNSLPNHQRRIRDAKPENVVGVATNIVTSTILQVCTTYATFIVFLNTDYFE